MESIKRITKGIIYKGLATVIVTFLGFATSIVLARYFGKDEYGKLIIVYTVASRIESIKKLLPVGLIRKSSIPLGLIILVNILSHPIGIHNIWLLFIISLLLFIFLQWLQKELQGEDFDFFMKVVRASLAGVCKKDTF